MEVLPVPAAAVKNSKANVSDPPQYAAVHRVIAGIDQAIESLCAKHFVPTNTVDGWLDWFESTHPEQFKKWWSAWLGINNPAAPQKEFNDHLRTYRDGSLWCMEQYVPWKKKQKLTSEIDARNAGMQERMAL
jgi:hypothetical protein